MTLLHHKETALMLVTKLLNSKKKITKINELAKDTIMEIGNILIGNYLAALSNFTNLNLLESVPHFASGTAKSIIEAIVEKHDGTGDEQVLIVATKITMKKDNFQGTIFLVLSPDTCLKLLKSLKKKLK